MGQQLCFTLNPRDFAQLKNKITEIKFNIFLLRMMATDENDEALELRSGCVQVAEFYEGS